MSEDECSRSVTAKRGGSVGAKLREMFWEQTEKFVLTPTSHGFFHIVDSAADERHEIFHKALDYMLNAPCPKCTQCSYSYDWEYFRSSCSLCGGSP